jgi:hypothetical protein
MGNQGVGKNKITDRLLELLRRPREYIQLHRDTTMSALTVVTSVEKGVIVFQDSPLVRAVRKGRVLVVDEADKAPVTITATLKSLAETGRMTLADGRRIVPPGELARRRKNLSVTADAEGGVEDIEMHPEFRMIILANRPGYPFMGNDFFATVGEAVSVHPLENPDPESEFALLSQAAPSIPGPTLKKLIGAFNDLRQAFDDGLVSYPYSLRELLHIVRHMEAFPEDSLGKVLRNVFDFDVHKKELGNVLLQALKKHGYVFLKTDEV